RDGRLGKRTLIAAAVTVVVAVAVASSLLTYAVVSAEVTKAAQGAGDHGAMPSAGPPSAQLVQALTRARAATVKYAPNLPAAQADGYKIITRTMPDMGVHYLNPDIKGFDVERPPILVYLGHAH